jgi:multidrug efflux pump subunit AcrA (membrane-fusion protein)
MQAQVAVESASCLLTGEVVQIVPQADLRSRSFPVKIRVQNPTTPSGYQLKSGMLGRASFFIGDESEILMVPKDALVLGQQILVMVIEESPSRPGQPPQPPMMTARPVPVEVGAALGNWIQVRGMLKPGEKVAIRGNERLMPGQPVIVIGESKEVPPSPAPLGAADAPVSPANESVNQ